MTVLLHALGAAMGGSVRHLRSFLPALAEADPEREYVLLVRESFPDLNAPGSIRIERIADVVARFPVARIVGDVVGLPLRVRRLHATAIVSLTNFGPVWSQVPHVLFQRNLLYYCQDYLRRARRRTRNMIGLRRRLAFESMKRADVVVTPSTAMADMIRDYYPELPSGRFRTLYHGFHAEAFQSPLDPRIAGMLAPCRGYRLVYPTHPAPHKGLKDLLDIAARLDRSGVDFCLYLTIGYGDLQREVPAHEIRYRDLWLSGRVVLLGSVPQSQMGELYRACDVMVYPSRCESFGFAMLEAMQYGLPIVAARTATNQEICGAGAFYYECSDPDSGVASILTALTDAGRSALKAGARARLTSFDWSWRRYATDFVQIVDSIR